MKEETSGNFRKRVAEPLWLCGGINPPLREQKMVHLLKHL